MKRPLTIVAIALLTALVIYACGSTIRTAHTSLVTITIGDGQKTAALHAEKTTFWSRLLYFLADAKLTPKAYADIPTVVKVVVVTVSAPDMTTMVTVVPVEGLTDIAITLEVPNGTGRNFLVEGFDASSTVVYRGQVSADLTGDPVSLTINLDSVAGDTLPPTFGGLTLVTNATGTTAQLFWSPATDTVTPPSGIVYLIYQATTSGGEIYTSPTYTTPAGAAGYTVSGLVLGNTYYFVVRARDAAGNIDGNIVERSGSYPGMYVSVGTGTDVTGCGAPANPCQTITFALTRSVDNANILVAPGVYSSASVSAASETFPLQLRTGTSLLCYGPNFSTVIDDSAGLGTLGVIINNASAEGGTLIDGCRVNTNTSSGSGAIDDSGLVMTVNNCSVNGVYSAGTGIQLSANSTVMNSTVTGFPGSEGGGAGIRTAANALISGNTITGNDYGIYSYAGSPIISSNSLAENAGYGIYIQDGSPTINNNTITNNNSRGIGSGSASATVSPVISNNVISGSYSGIYMDSGGTWTISGNMISGNTGYGIEIYALSNIGGTITGNTININGVGIAMNGYSTVTFPSINNNSLSCNTTYNLSTSATTTIDVTNNSWENAPPIVMDAFTGCNQGTDICYNSSFGPVPNSLPYNAAVPGVCNRPVTKPK